MQTYFSRSLCLLVQYTKESIVQINIWGLVDQPLSHVLQTFADELRRERWFDRCLRAEVMTVIRSLLRCYAVFWDLS